MTIFDAERATSTNALLFAMSRFGHGIAMRFRELKARHDTRKALGGVSEKHLRDIGLTRFDIRSNGELPLAKDAGEELGKIARARAGNW